MGNNIWRQASYNSRLQMSSFIDSVNNQTSNELLNATLNWGTTQNNGNLMGSTYNNGGAAANNGGISYPTFLSFTQGYIYDGVNRLNTVEEWNSSTSPEVANYSRSFAYDSYGNMFVSYASADLPPAGNTPTSYIFDSNNQFTNATYDDAGNELTANGNKINCDAESRQTSVVDVATGINELYLYDGEGKRVAKQTYGGTPTTVFAYDALGRMAAEYSTSVDTPTCVTCYLSPDHLGTARLVTDQSGIVVARHDYLPFGEEIPANIVGRNSQWGSGNDSINEKFTGKERDSESGLDYFGARYYGSALGRFTSADPKQFSIRTIADPQKWNKYAYTINNPLRYFDPDGFEELNVQLRSFIQQKTVSDPIGRQFAGDNRSFTSAQNVSSRTSITVRIETDPNIRPGNPIISITQPGVAGATHQVDANGNVIAQKTATSGLPTVVGGRDANGNATLSFTQDTKNPFEPQALTPGISSNLNVTVGQSGSFADISGNLSMSPSFEMNFGSTNVPLNSEFQGPAFGLGLIAPNSSVNQFVPLPAPPPPPPACANQNGHCQ